MTEKMQVETSSRKRQASISEEEEVLCGKKPKKPAAEGNDEGFEPEDMLAWLTLDEETVTELSKVLEPDEASSWSALDKCNFKVRFIDNPYISPVIVQSSSAYVTINGNEESCGSSFSDSESSVMASVDRCSVARSSITECSGEFIGSDATEVLGRVEGSGGGDAQEGLIDGCDLFDVDVGDEDMWEKFLGEDLLGGPLESEPVNVFAE